MKPIDTTVEDVRNLFDLMHYYGPSNYDEKIISNFKIRENCKKLIKSLICFAWTDEAGMINPTKEMINKFPIHGMSVGINKIKISKDDNPDNAVYEVTYTISIDYWDHDYICVDITEEIGGL